MKIRICDEPAEAAEKLPEKVNDRSGVGVQYADAYLKSLKVELEDGRKVQCKRRGLKLTLSIGEQKGTGLMRRLVHGPDAPDILRAALEEAAADLGAALSFEGGVIYLGGV